MAAASSEAPVKQGSADTISINSEQPSQEGGRADASTALPRNSVEATRSVAVPAREKGVANDRGRRAVSPLLSSQSAQSNPNTLANPNAVMHAQANSSAYTQQYVQAPAPYVKGALVSFNDSIDAEDYEVTDRNIVGRERLSGKSDLREYLAERSREIFEFISPLEAQIKKTVRSRKGSPELKRSMVLRVAELVSSVIRQISQRETGLFTLEPNLALMSSALLAGPAESSIVEGLYQRAQAVLGAIQRASLSSGHRAAELSISSHAPFPGTAASAAYGEFDDTGSATSRQLRSLVDGYDVAREIEELTMLLRWYARRKSSLALAEWQTGISGVENVMINDALFGLEVLHDHEVFGVKGCFVCGGLRLIGHDGQALWLRVSAEFEGQPITIREGWDTWVDFADESNLFGTATPFASLVPIRPNAQRLIIDDVRCFVPYGAFDIPAGKSNLTLVVSLIDHEGDVLLQTSQLEEVCVPPRADKTIRSASPHSIGMWPHDVVSGDKISNLRVSSGYSQIGHWEQLTVNVSCDLALFMHPGEPVVIECRFSSEDGSLVEVSPQGAASGDGNSGQEGTPAGSYRVRRVIRPRTAWASYTGLTFDVPVDFLYVEPGRHTLMCEIVVLSADDRILCGDLAAVDVIAPTPIRRESAASTQSPISLPAMQKGTPAQPLPNIELESLEVNPSYGFGENDCVRVQATFCAKPGSPLAPTTAHAAHGEFALPYRVIISLEQEDGTLFLQGFSDELGVTYRPATRSVCVEGSGSARESSVVCNFAHREIRWSSLRGDLRQNPGKTQVFVRVRALSLDGQSFIDETKEIFIKPEQSADTLRDVHLGEVRPGIVDAVAATYLQSRRFSARLLLNLPSRVAAREGVTVVAYLPGNDASGRQEIFRNTVAPRHIGLWSRAGLELVQVPVEFEGTIDSSARQPPLLTLELIGEFGEVLERFKQAVRVSESVVTGDSVAPSTNPEQNGAKQINGARSQESDSAVRPGRGFFAWLAGKTH